MKEIMIFWGAEMDSSERAGVYGDENVKGLL